MIDLDELERLANSPNINTTGCPGFLSISKENILELIRRLREAERKIESLEQDIREYVDAQPPI